MTKKTTPETIAPTSPKFLKEQLIKSERYRERRDLLTVLLKDGKQYSHDEIEGKMKDFMKGKVI